jgi:hypothetical protein
MAVNQDAVAGYQAACKLDQPVDVAAEWRLDWASAGVSMADVVEAKDQVVALEGRAFLIGVDNRDRLVAVQIPCRF